MNDIYIDIETIPNQSPEYHASVRAGIKPPGTIKKPESIEAWMAENADAVAAETIAKTSLDPATGHICCLGFAIGNGKAQYYEARKLEDERHILGNFFAVLPDIGLNRFIGHYISGFDIRFILCRAVALGVQLPTPTMFPRDIKPWSQEIFDTMVAWSGAKDRISQDNLCRALGLPGKGSFDGSMVAEAWADGRYGEIARYCLHDVETVRAIHHRFEAVGF